MQIEPKYESTIFRALLIGIQQLASSMGKIDVNKTFKSGKFVGAFYIWRIPWKSLTKTPYRNHWGAT